MTRDETISALNHIRSAIRNHITVNKPLRAIEAIDLAIAALENINDCKNELCLRCGNYKMRHKGACDGCRWMPKEET